MLIQRPMYAAAWRCTPAAQLVLRSSYWTVSVQKLPLARFLPFVQSITKSMVAVIEDPETILSASVINTVIVASDRRRAVRPSSAATGSYCPRRPSNAVRRRTGL